MYYGFIYSTCFISLRKAWLLLQSQLKTKTKEPSGSTLLRLYMFKKLMFVVNKRAILMKYT